MKVVNGVKEIEVEEGGKKVKITDDPQQGIKIEVTSKENGKEVTKKYEAKDAKELEKKQPEGYKLYKEHAVDQNVGGGGGILQFQFNAGGIQLAPAVPAPMRQSNQAIGKCRCGASKRSSRPPRGWRR